MIRTGVTDGAILPEAILAEVGSDADGAVLLFLGTVRDHHGGRRVKGLTYEAYREMAEEVLATIASEAKERFQTTRLAALHRVGSLKVGDVATAIAVSAPHREEAYGASRYVIEELKKRLPVWKQEEYVDGERTWVAGHVPVVGHGGRGMGDQGGGPVQAQGGGPARAQDSGPVQAQGGGPVRAQDSGPVRDQGSGVVRGRGRVGVSAPGGPVARTPGGREGAGEEP